MRDWARERRKRTRRLIELGGLVHKAGLVDLLDDDRAALLGLLLDAADGLREDQPQGVSRADLLARWRRRGLRAFEADREATLSAVGRREERHPEPEGERA